ncbi:MAG: ribosome small subunit-dependent GTPase A [Candidatus Hydrogenedens sp.]|nr:ribosome small subunit-dependent GTPase A [Candidatus Hydrogenedens sp.]
MAKKKKLEKKKRRTVRERDWLTHGESSFTHDLVRHRRAQVKLSESSVEQAAPPEDFEPNATVISHSKKWGFVQMDGSEQLCIIDERLKEHGATLIAPGDEVLVEIEEDEAIIRAIAPRRSRLSRPSTRHHDVSEQVIAANVDHLIVVAAAAEPPFRAGLVDRYLIAAQTGGIEPLLCINKMDLVEEPPAEVALYKDLGVQVFLTSCETRAGLDALLAALRGKTAVLSGHSGVGKSSLLNALDPDLRLHTQPISDHSRRGQHTTTLSRLYELRDGIRIIDTPGIRALGLWQVSPEEVAYYFPDIAEVSAACRFRDCTHTHEPECAVRAAVEAGTLHRGRYDSYLRIRASLESDTGTTPGRMASNWQAGVKGAEE